MMVKVMMKFENLAGIMSRRNRMLMSLFSCNLTSASVADSGFNFFFLIRGCIFFWNVLSFNS